MPLSSKKRAIRFLTGLTWLTLSACVQQSEVSLPKTPQESRKEIVIAAMGDIMMPLSIQKAVARNKYNYDILFEKIAKDLGSVDLAVGNLETPVDHTAPISGYPKFNARPGLLAALKKAGVGIVSVANNHAMDAGPGGLKRTIENLEASGLRFFGGGRTEDEARQAAVLDLRGITMAFLAYTYSTNERMPMKKKNAPRVNILRSGSLKDLARAATDVRKARQSADLVVVSLHWSEEYRRVPTPWQRQAAAKLIEEGADIILGHHPHVLQPIESYVAQNGRQGLIAFSLGNFISSQNSGVKNRNRTNSKALRGDGIILNIFVVKEQGKTSIARAEFTPIWTFCDQVGKTVVYRPVNLARETARLEGMPMRTKEENNTLSLLGFRKQVILNQMTAKPSP